MHRLEGRLNGLAEQIELMGHSVASRSAPADDLADRLEALTARVEELANAKQPRASTNGSNTSPSCSRRARERHRSRS
jgi:hypothetical protein